VSFGNANRLRWRYEGISSVASKSFVRIVLAVVGACANVVLAAGPNAATATGNLSVTATVVNSCAISSITAVAFGTYDPIEPDNSGGVADPSASNGALTVTCAQPVSTTIQLDQDVSPVSGHDDIVVATVIF
jgi:spore coat protein U-like protein